MVITDIGPVEIEVLRDRAGSFEPQMSTSGSGGLNAFEITSTDACPPDETRSLHNPDTHR
jgi:hypothetical protein